MTRDAAHYSIFRTSDFIVLLALAIGTLAELLFLSDRSLPLSTAGRLAVGIPLAAAGVGFIVAARAALGRAKQPSGPGLPTTRIVTSGIFRYTRNPTYLGLGILMLGAGIAMNFIAWIALSAAVVVAMHYLLVLPEERYLAERFPDEFADYKSKARRWI